MIPRAIAFDWETDDQQHEALLVLSAGPADGPG